jgi:tyrosyl-tRNA synthetase
MDVDAQIRELADGAVDLISEADLRARLERGRPLRVKLGIDPTASDIHLGFAVVLRKLRRFQDLGHLAVLILGDFTAQVGDPSGRNKTRPRLSAEEVDRHARTYLEQVTRILDPDRLEVRRNSEWLAPLGIEDILALMSSMTVAQMLERDDFSKRYASGSPVTLTEFLYPLLQGHDSVMVEADVELGGTDQLFNLLVGRHLQAQAGQEPQVVLTTPLLPGISGGAKMSKSLGNYVGIAEAPAEQFGKIMSIPDDLLPQYLRYTTGWPAARVADVEGSLEGSPPARAAAKRLLARTVIDLYHGESAGEVAEAEFDRVFKEKAEPSEIPEFAVPPTIVDDQGLVQLAKLLSAAGLVDSVREGRRKIVEGGVRLDGAVVDDPDLTLEVVGLAGKALQVGKRSWVRVVDRA